MELLLRGGVWGTEYRARVSSVGLGYMLWLRSILTFTSICLVDRSFLLARWAGWAGKADGLVRLKNAVRA